MSLRFRSGGAVETSTPAQLEGDSLVEFVTGDVACRVQFIVADRERRVAMYDIVLANKRDVNISCRLFDRDRNDRRTDIAIFDVAGNSQGRSRFTVPLVRRTEAQRVYIEILGTGIAMLFETRLPRPKPASATRWIVAAVLAVAVAAAVFFSVAHRFRPASAASPSQAMDGSRAAGYHAIDDAATSGSSGFTYSGEWQHVANMHDGRSDGTSSRSYHIGDMAYFKFTGDRLKLFGIRGPTGGFAELSIDGQPRQLLRFYAPRKMVSAEIYASPRLPSGVHAVDIVVLEAVHDPSKRRYVNLDGAAYAGR